jgi:hypothetical protein
MFTLQVSFKQLHMYNIQYLGLLYDFLKLELEIQYYDFISTYRDIKYF